MFYFWEGRFCFWEGRKRNDCLKHIFPARGDTKSRAWVAEKSAVDVRDGWKVQSPRLPSSVCNQKLEFRFGHGIRWLKVVQVCQELSLAMDQGENRS